MRLAFGPVGSARQDELLELWVDSWTGVYPGIDFAARIPWFTQHMEDLAAAGCLRHGAFGADDRLAGFILLDPATGHLDQFCVRRDLKGAGVAGALMAETRRLSPGGVTLDVNAANARAIRFYEREGFEKTGEGVNPRSGFPIFHYRWRP